MSLRVTEDQVQKCMAEACTGQGLEQPLLYYYTYDMGPVWKRLLMAGGVLQAFLWKYYYIAISGENLVLQQITMTQKPKGRPVVIPFTDIAVSAVKRKMLFTLVSLRSGENKYSLTFVKRVGGWPSSRDQQEHFIAKFEELLKQKIQRDNHEQD